MCFKTLATTSLITTTTDKHSVFIDDIELRYCRRIDELADFIESAGKNVTDLFMTPLFLNVLEKAPPTGFQFCYIAFLKNDHFLGLMVCEIKHFKADESLNFSVKSSPTLLLKFRKWLAQKVQFQTLIVGSLLLTGEHSFIFKSDFPTDYKNILIENGVIHAKKMLAEENVIIKNVFFKDFFTSQKWVGSNNKYQSLLGEGYNEFQVEPNFIFNIPSDWGNFDDYLAALSSKYRVRAKRAFKKCQQIEAKVFNEERILAHKDRINELYYNVRNKSAFNLVDLNENYFYELKRQLGDKFRLIGYFSPSGDLIGFFTTIENGEELEAHFLGYDAQWNHTHQIYLNFLFDIIKIGIETQSKRVIFGRTANEIKSSVGAEAHDMYLYMKHENPIINRLLPYFLRILKPREVWVPRQPFKESD